MTDSIAAVWAAKADTSFLMTDSISAVWAANACARSSREVKATGEGGGGVATAAKVVA